MTYSSYDFKRWCSKCGQWRSKEDFRCSECGTKLRNHGRRSNKVVLRI